MIRFTCPHCSQPFELPDHLAGRRASCGHAAAKS